MPRDILLILTLAAALLGFLGNGFLGTILEAAEQHPEPGSDTAAPTTWPAEVADVFFEDATKQLSGDSPAQQDQFAEPAKEQAAKPGPPTSAAEPNQAWSKLIGAETLATEVKRLANNLANYIQRPARFQAAQHADARRDLFLLAALMQIIHEYPSKLPTQDHAQAMRELCLQAAANCRDGSTESLEHVRDFSAQLADLLRGQNVELPAQNVSTDSPTFGALMQRMEAATKKLPDLLIREREFRKHTLNITHEAELLAALSQLIGQEEYGYTGDDTYQSHADKLRSAALALKAAASAERFTEAVEASQAVSQSCAQCHADYRG